MSYFIDCLRSLHLYGTGKETQMLNLSLEPVWIYRRARGFPFGLRAGLGTRFGCFFGATRFFGGAALPGARLGRFLQPYQHEKTAQVGAESKLTAGRGTVFFGRGAFAGGAVTGRRWGAAGRGLVFIWLRGTTFFGATPGAGQDGADGA